MEYDESVEYYAEGVVRMRICFPHGKADCRHCRFIRYRDALGLYQCTLTDELLEKYQLDDRGRECPVEMQETPF